MLPRVKIRNETVPEGAEKILKKFLASVGIGAARIDLMLPQETYRAGEEVSGTLRIESGKVDQEVNSVYLQLLVKSRYGSGDDVKHVSKILDTAQISGALSIRAGDPAQEIPVRYGLPVNVPLSARHTKLFLLTGLDVSKAVDPGDADPIVIRPDWRREAVFRALEEELGFCPSHDSGEYNGRFQEFEFKPMRFMRGKLDELEVVFDVQNDGVRLYLEIDRKGRFLELFDLDETEVSCFVPDRMLRSVPETARFLADFIASRY
ncbi:MAG: sporulation protein [Bacillota bacterium]